MRARVGPLLLQVKEAEATEREIDATREKYRPVAFRASILYFCITDLSSVDPMYQYSLPWFTNLFVNSIKNSSPADDIPQRIANLNSYSTASVYRNVCRSLFETHKLLFSFLMAVKILQGDGSIDAAEWRFLIAGQSPNIHDMVSVNNPAPEWITDRMWLELETLSTLPKFRDVAKRATLDAALLDGMKQIFDSNDRYVGVRLLSFMRHTHTHTRARARARVCPAPVCVYVACLPAVTASRCRTHGSRASTRCSACASCAACVPTSCCLPSKTT
ncbi:hypothetical protein EON62_02720 [archaeon]|nr:MAG: hypothetical protein EON62_02720 [archaeon]